MKKKIIISLLLIIPFVSIILVVVFRAVFMPSNDEIIRDLKNIKCYETKVEYIIKNNKGEEREETVQYFSKDDGTRIEFEDESVKIFKDDQILVRDSISGKEYTLDGEMDILHSLAFVEDILSLPLKTDSMKEGQEEWGEKIYIQIDTELFLNNDHFNTARVFIDKKTKSPIGVIVYDKDGNDSLRIVYEDFKEVKELEDGLFQ